MDVSAVPLRPRRYHTSARGSEGAAGPAQDPVTLQRIIGNQGVQAQVRAGTLPRRLLLEDPRTMGNRVAFRVLSPMASAASDRAPIRRLTSRADFLNDTDQTDAAFIAIGQLLDRYNTTKAIDPQHSAQLNECFRLLRKIDRRIYRWFDTVSQVHLRLAEEPHTARMHALLQETEAEHIALVHRTKDKSSVFPFDLSTVPVPEQQGVIALWRSIVDGTGKIKLIGGHKHRRKTRSELAKLLSTPTGRDLLRFLNTPTLRQPLNDPLTNIYIGDDVSRLDAHVAAQSPEVGDRNQSEAAPLGAPDTRHKLADPQPLDGSEDLVNDFKVVNNPIDFRTAVLTGMRGVVFNNQKYLFGPGTGSFVKTIRGDSVSVGHNVHEIIKPGFITLGHELGHAAHERAGATTMAYARQDVMANLTGLSPDTAKLWWDNSEEFLNIANTENPVRVESGISPRASHKAQGALLRTQRSRQLDAQITAIAHRDPVVDFLDAFRVVSKRLSDELGQLDDDTAHDDLRAAIVDLGNLITPQYIATQKRQLLSTAFQQLQPHRKKLTGWGAKKQHKQEYKRIKGEVNKNINTYIQAGNHAQFQRLRNDIRALKTSVST